VRLSLIVLKVEVKEEIHELLISGRKCALREIGAQIKLYVLQWTSGHLAKRLSASHCLPSERNDVAPRPPNGLIIDFNIGPRARTILAKLMPAS